MKHEGKIFHMRSALTVFMCLSFSFFAIGCYSLQPENISRSHTIMTKDAVELKMNNGRQHTWPGSRIDSIRVEPSQVAVFTDGLKYQSMYPIDSVKALYVTKINGFRTVVTSVFLLTIAAPIILLIAFPLRLS